MSDSADSDVQDRATEEPDEVGEIVASILVCACCYGGIGAIAFCIYKSQSTPYASPPLASGTPLPPAQATFPQPAQQPSTLVACADVSQQPATLIGSQSAFLEQQRDELEIMLADSGYTTLDEWQASLKEDEEEATSEKNPKKKEKLLISLGKANIELQAYMQKKAEVAGLDGT